MEICSEDPKNNFTLIPYGLLQMTNSETYRRTIIFQYNFITTMTIIPIYGVTKIATREKVEENFLQNESISSIEETHLYEDKGRWLTVTSKACKT